MSDLKKYNYINNNYYYYYYYFNFYFLFKYYFYNYNKNNYKLNLQLFWLLFKIKKIIYNFFNNNYDINFKIIKIIKFNFQKLIFIKKFNFFHIFFYKQKFKFQINFNYLIGVKYRNLYFKSINIFTVQKYKFLYILYHQLQLNTIKDSLKNIFLFLNNKLIFKNKWFSLIIFWFYFLWFNFFNNINLDDNYNNNDNNDNAKCDECEYEKYYNNIKIFNHINIILNRNKFLNNFLKFNYKLKNKNKIKNPFKFNYKLKNCILINYINIDNSYFKKYKTLKIINIFIINKNIIYKQIYNIKFIYKIYNLINKLYEKSCQNEFFIYNSYFKLSFLLPYNGFLFLTDMFQFYIYKYKIEELRKHLNSFSLKNELNKYLLKETLKSNQLKLIQNELIDNSAKNDLFFIDQIWINKLNRDIYIEDDIIKEFSILRIKFKPGYQKIWREARIVLKKILNVNYIYQYKLTKLLLNLHHSHKHALIYFFEMKLFNILIQTQFIPYKEFLITFIKNKLIFVNGINCINLNYQIYLNDLIQFIIHIKYYIYYKFIINYYLKHKITIKFRTQKMLNIETKLFATKKILNLPRWLLKEIHFENDIPSYLEIDFLTLSIFVIYEPFLFDHMNSMHIHYLKKNILNMYNWKYIT